jgi:hypothetical protein
MARREHWNLTMRGIGRTGFVNGGYCGNQSFPLRVRQVVADHPQMVVGEGGLNDAGQSGIGAAARAVLAKIPATTRVVVIGRPTRQGVLAPTRRPSTARWRNALRLPAALAAAIRPGRNPYDCGRQASSTVSRFDVVRSAARSRDP